MNTCINRSLNIGFWNIHKIISKNCNKTHDEVFLKSVEKCDIFALAETKCDGSNINLDNYYTHSINRTKTLSQKQDYGGLAISIHKNIRKGVTYIKNTCSEFQWLL